MICFSKIQTRKLNTVFVYKKYIYYGRLKASSLMTFCDLINSPGAMFVFIIDTGHQLNV